MVDPSQFGSKGYGKDEVRFVLKLLTGEEDVYGVEDHLRPSPPDRSHYAAAALNTCQVLIESAEGKPLRAHFDGKRLKVDFGKVEPPIQAFRLTGDSVTGCSGLNKVPAYRIASELERE